MLWPVTYHLYEVKGWPVIAWDDDRPRYERYRHVGRFENARAMIQVYDEMVERARDRALEPSKRLSSGITRKFL